MSRTDARLTRERGDDADDDPDRLRLYAPAATVLHVGLPGGEDDREAVQRQQIAAVTMSGRSTLMRRVVAISRC